MLQKKKKKVKLNINKNNFIFHNGNEILLSNMVYYDHTNNTIYHPLLSASAREIVS